MSREFSFNLSVPIDDIDEINTLLDKAKIAYGPIRISRKPDRGGAARFYLSFPFAASRSVGLFQEWFQTFQKHGWELFGPTHGRWGLK